MTPNGREASLGQPFLFQRPQGELAVKEHTRCLGTVQHVGNSTHFGSGPRDTYLIGKSLISLVRLPSSKRHKFRVVRDQIWCAIFQGTQQNSGCPYGFPSKTTRTQKGTFIKGTPT